MFFSVLHLHGSVYLFREQLLTEPVESDELVAQNLSALKSLRHQHDLTDQLHVRNHHGTRPAKQQLYDICELIYTQLTLRLERGPHLFFLHSM